MNLDIGIADADLIENVNERFPNSASMRISTYHKKQNDRTKLITSWDEVKNFHKVYISKVFTDTKVPTEILSMPNVIYGGTGFYYPEETPPLPPEIEHQMPDYHLYDDWVKEKLAEGKAKNKLLYYTDCSIGKLTTKCFMGCYFCVNRHYKKVEFFSPLNEFYDESKNFILLLDDQFLGYENWEELLDQLITTGKPFQFKQGLDIRLMTDQKAEKLALANYHEDYIFAFDSMKDCDLIRRKLQLWRQYTDARTKLYVFCGSKEDKRYTESFWIQDITDTFERIFILAEYNCIPYIMRHKDYLKSPYRKIYINLASWTAQVWTLKTLTYRQYCIRKGMGKLDKVYKGDSEKYLKDGHKKGSAWIEMERFGKKYPEIAARYFDKRFSDLCVKAV